MIKLLFILLAVPAAAYGFLPAAAIVGASLGSGPAAPIVAGGLGLAGLFWKLFGGRNQQQGPQAPIDPYTNQIMAIDPKTGLNQRVVDKLWSYQPQGMQWMGDAASFTDAQTGLPNWLVNRLNLATKYGANWMGFFKDNQTFDGNLPQELEWLLTVPWGTLASDYDFGDMAPAQPPGGDAGNVQGGTPEALNQPQVNEGQATSYPEGQQPDMTGQDPTFSTTVYGQSFPPELIAAAGGLGAGLLANQLIQGPLQGAGVPSPGMTSNLSPVQDPYNSVPEPNPNNVPDFVPPPTFSVDVWGNPLPGAGVPTQPNIINDVPWFYGEGTATGDPITPVPSVINGQITQQPLPGAGVPTVSMPIGGQPTTTTPPAPSAPNTPAPTPQIPNIPIGGGAGAALPPGFPVVGGGPLIQTVFGPIPAPQAPPSIVDFLRRMS